MPRRQYTGGMTYTVLAVAVALFSAALPGAQERKVPDDSVRLSVPGCAKGRTFVVGRTPGHEPIRSNVEPGRRFRLSGKKALLQNIEKQEGTMIEVTGLVRRSQLAGPGGVAIGGIRIGGGPPVAGGSSDAYRDLRYHEVVLDLESWRVLTEPCPRR